MKKGITPVIAMILLVLIVVALGGVFAAWTTRSWEQLGETGEQQIEQVSEQLQMSIAIDTVQCANPGIIYVRNAGSVEITCAEMTLYVDDVLTAKTCTTDPLPSGVVTDLTTLVDLSSGGPTVRVTVPGNSATYRCKT